MVHNPLVSFRIPANLSTDDYCRDSCFSFRSDDDVRTRAVCAWASVGILAVLRVVLCHCAHRYGLSSVSLRPYLAGTVVDAGAAAGVGRAEPNFTSPANEERYPAPLPPATWKRKQGEEHCNRSVHVRLHIRAGAGSLLGQVGSAPVVGTGWAMLSCTGPEAVLCGRLLYVPSVWVNGELPLLPV